MQRTHTLLSRLAVATVCVRDVCVTDWHLELVIVREWSDGRAFRARSTQRPIRHAMRASACACACWRVYMCATRRGCGPTTATTNYVNARVNCVHVAADTRAFRSCTLTFLHALSLAAGDVLNIKIMYI